MRRLPTAIGTLTLTGLLLIASTKTRADGPTNRSTSKAKAVVVGTTKGPEKLVTIRVLKDSDEETSPAKDRAWLGVAVEEAPEALTEQLGLEAGVGLVVSHVRPDSPAAEAGLKKNDVLVALAGQSLVHPAQLRKLVQARPPGEKVQLEFYRAGKKQAASATLAKAPAHFDLTDDSGALREDLRELQRELRELPIGDAIGAYTKSLHESLGPLAAEQKTKFREELQRSLEAVRKALHEAAQQMSNAQHSLGPAHGALKDLFKSGISVNTNATVIVRSSGKSSRTLVKSDESGTIILIGPPNLRLTVRDRDGKLLFDGEIETPGQRANVPPEVWERVEPLLEEKAVSPGATESPKPPTPPQTSAAAGVGSAVTSPRAL